MQDMLAPTTAKELKAAKKVVGEYVSSFINNTPTMAIKSYVNPAIFQDWEAAIEE